MEFDVNDDTHDENYEPVFIARQPIFDCKMNIWGYELLFRNSRDVNSAVIADSSQATSQVIMDGIAWARQGIAPDKAIMINFPRQLLMDDTPMLLPEGCIVEILEDVEPDEQVVERCRQIKRHCRIAVDDFTGQSGYEELLDVANIVKVDVLDMNNDRIRSVAESVRKHKNIMLAEKVETREVFRVAGKLGFSLFQGYFFSKPEIIRGRKLSSNQAARLRLMQELEQREFDPKTLSAIIESDVSLSYRLLRYINSPGIGLLAQIKSIRHAINMLGEKRIRQWLRILIMADLNSTDRGLEMLRLSSMRGYLLHLMAESYPSPMDPNAMFLTGLFSGLDAILDQPMDSILKDLPLDARIKNTLMGEENDTRRYLNLAMALEKGNWAGLNRLMYDLGLKTEIIAGLHIQTVKWGDNLLSGSLGDKK